MRKEKTSTQQKNELLILTYTHLLRFLKFELLFTSDNRSRTFLSTFELKKIDRQQIVGNQNFADLIRKCYQSVNSKTRIRI